ncbi:AAA family ATPase [Schlesneria sp. DSM 10557]|uniref:AAA family ATPase n=1 Tax=Schlesneria sp. DSM 10557 TaxID=3044399 RepID=UPI0035C7D9B0
MSDSGDFDPAVFDTIRNDGRPVNHDIKTPHQSLDAEMSCLGCMLLDAAGADAGLALLSRGDLYSELHRHVYDVIATQRRDGCIPDLVTVCAELASRRVLRTEQEAGLFLLPMLEKVAHSANIGHYAFIVREKAVRRAATYAIRDTMRRLEDPSSSLDEVLAEAASRISTVSETVAFNAKPKFRVLTSGELDAADIRTEFLIDDILVKGQPCILAAVKKCLKTTIAVDLSLSVGSGSKFVNRFTVPRPMRVAFMSGESGEATIQETARRIARSKPWHNLSDYENNIWSSDLPRLGRPETKLDLIKFIRDNALDVLIVDPAYLCLDIGDEAGNLFKVGPKLMDLTEVMAETGCTIILIHHCKKSTNDPFAIPELENISWAGFQEWARQWILLNRRERYDPEQSGTHKLWLTVGGSAGHSGGWALDIDEGSRNDRGGRRWDVSVQPISAAIAETIENRESAKEEQTRIKAERQVEKDMQKLLEQYRKHPDGNTETFFTRAAVLTGTRARAATDRLKELGAIEVVKIRKANKQEYDGYRLSTQHRESVGTTGNIPLVPTGSTHTGNNPLRGVPSVCVWQGDESSHETSGHSFPVADPFGETTF